MIFYFIALWYRMRWWCYDVLDY